MFARRQTYAGKEYKKTTPQWHVVVKEIEDEGRTLVQMSCGVMLADDHTKTGLIKQATITDPEIMCQNCLAITQMAPTKQPYGKPAE